ncbi:fibroin heavy chain-like [Lepus europaeus]|uniref:fibroin heavy chain-like n=1 Tax=Lepus europaeus TaxID=9983 RepID=UPI002B486A6C|nr:fibroin heavy chain-like [Lepus europaeus]
MAGPPSPSSIPRDDKLRINRDFSLRLSQSERELQALRQQVYNLATRLEKYSGGKYKTLLHHTLEEKGRLGLLQVVSPVPAVFNMPGVIAPYHQNVRLCPKMDVKYHYCLATSAAHVYVVNPGIGYSVCWGPSAFVELSYHRAEVLKLTNSYDEEEVAEDCTAKRNHENIKSRPGVHAPYHQTLWACPEPEYGYHYFFGDTAAAYAGAYPTGATSPVGWGPGSFAGRPYRRAQIVELSEEEEEEAAEQKQEPAAPAAESEAPCGPGVHAPYHQTLWACPEPEYGYHYFFGDTAAAYAGAYPTGATSPVGWGPGSFAGRPYRRAQIVELSEEEEEEAAEQEQEPAAPAAESEAPCGPGVHAPYHQTLWACPEPEYGYHYFFGDTAAAYAGAYPTGATSPVGWGPGSFAGRPYRRAQIVELSEEEEEEAAEQEQEPAAPAAESEAPCGPGVHAPYHQTLWACPEPEYGYHYFFGDTAAAYAGAYPTGATSPVGWGPGSFAGRPYRRAQIVELSEEEEEEAAEQEQEPAAPAAESEAPCGPGVHAPYHQTLWACPEPEYGYHYFFGDTAAAYAGAYPTGATSPVGWGPGSFAGRPYRRAQIVELSEEEEEEAAEQEQEPAAPAAESKAPCGPGVHAPYHQTLWACPEPEYGYHYFFGDTAAAYAGAYPTGATSPVGWGPGSFAGRPYRRAQIVELSEEEEEEAAEQEQEPAAPAAESEAPCGPGVHAPYHQTLWACPEPEYGYHYFFGDTAAAYAGAYPTGATSPVGWGPGSFAGRPYRRAQIVELSEEEEEEAAEQEQEPAAPAAESEAPCGPGVHAPYHQTLWACPEPEYGYHYFFGDTAAAYAGAYPTGATSPVGWGPGSFAGRPYRRAQIVELSEEEEEEAAEQEQEPAAPAAESEAPCGERGGGGGGGGAGAGAGGARS